MSYNVPKDWPQWIVRVEDGKVVEERIFDSFADIPVDAGWMTKDAFAELASKPEGEDDQKPAKRQRKTSE